MKKIYAQQKLDEILKDNYIAVCTGEDDSLDTLTQVWLAPKGFFDDSEDKARAWFEEVANELRADILADNDHAQWTPDRDDYDDHYAWEEACYEAEEGYYTYGGESWVEFVETVDSLGDALDEINTDFVQLVWLPLENQPYNYEAMWHRDGDNTYFNTLLELAEYDEDDDE